MRVRLLFEGFVAAALFLFAGIELAEAATLRAYLLMGSLGLLGAAFLGDLIRHASRPGSDGPVV